MEHELNSIAEFTRKAVYIPLPSGARMQVPAPLKHRDWRWYCTCGAMSGSKATKTAARAGFAQHKEAAA